MPELAVTHGLDCIGYINETEGGCDAIAVIDGRNVKLGRFANRGDARAAIIEASRAGDISPSEEPVSSSGRAITGADTEPVSASTLNAFPPRNRTSKDAYPHELPAGERAGR
ncbi:hypothetical protein [Microbaculum sp. FT89]|uniref:hypothetical protein n=1 Tax=Microbaculum sp. FT89 TaxID=3447298 RepID=UPI003F52B8F5